MNITTKTIITDTNILTDLNNADLLEEYISLDNVYISDILYNDEINNNTCNLKIIKKAKLFHSDIDYIIEARSIYLEYKRLSFYDVINFLIARDNNFILASGDNALKKFAEKNNVETIRTLKIIKLLVKKNIISIDKAIKGCNKLLETDKTRIPKEDITLLIKELEKELITI